MRIERIGDANAAHQRSDVTARRELGLALQTDKAVGPYAALPARRRTRDSTS